MAKFTLALEAVVGLLIARLPRSICTEILACDRSMPELCSACVRELNNLFQTKQSYNPTKFNLILYPHILDIEWTPHIVSNKKEQDISN